MERKRLLLCVVVISSFFSLFVLTDWFESLYQNYINKKNHRWRRALRLDPRTVVRKEDYFKSNTDIIVLVMGEASTFKRWYQHLKAIDGHLSLVFASYDEKVPNYLCESNEEFDCQTIFIPSKSWTQGRNLLAQTALRKEEIREKEFDYWLFLDDDVEPVCRFGSVKVLGDGSCWQKIFNFISSDNVPERASTISLPRFAKEGFASTSNTDAFFAAFKREAVPYLLPYATLPNGSSEWISQAANFCVVGTCLTNSSVFVPYVNAKNTKSRPFIREGFNIQNIHRIVTHNYHNLSSNFTPCHNWNKMAYYAQGEHGTGIVGPFETSDELNQHILPHKHEFCLPLRNRFWEWEKSVMESLSDDSFPTFLDDSSTLPEGDTSNLQKNQISILKEDY
mmetsp:Transcript_38723/g.44230  ORF Transcript_38723/g.44230 Transcript_38723/m.44230 type:complete len:393 (-) Transcript_38723:217-1395(-)